MVLPSILAYAAFNIFFKLYYFLQFLFNIS